MDSPAAPGTIADVLARLLLWCRRSDHGFIRIIFDDGAARDEVIRQFRQQLPPRQIFHELLLPPAATPQILAERLADDLARLGPGIISLTGFEVSLPPTGPAMVAALRALNARRETFIHPGQHTLWWFPRHVALALSQEHLDLNSWFLKRADLTETLSTPEDREITDRWHQANRLRESAHHGEAEAIIRKILDQEQARLGPDHPRVAIALNNLAQLLQATNRLAEAEPLMQQAWQIHEASYGPDHPLVAIDINNLATLLQATNRLAEAEPLMRRVVGIFEKAYGENHPQVATALNNLAQLLQATNRLSEAEPLYRRALKMDEASYGPDHPAVATDLNNLAQLLKATNRLSEAEPLYRRALKIDEAAYGPDHPQVATALNNLAVLLHHTHRLAEAKPLMERALKIDEASYGPDHPDVARDLYNLAGFFIATNRLAEAEPLIRRAVGIFLRFQVSTGYPHPHWDDAIRNYVRLLLEMGRTEGEMEGKLREVFAEAGGGLGGV